jgi:hypothetical protein
MSKETRSEIRLQLVQARSEFIRRLETLPTHKWDLAAAGSSWSIRQVFTRIVQRTDLLSSMASGAANRHNFMNYPQPILHFAERWLIRFSSRRQTPQSLAEDYHKTFQTALILLEDIPEENWQNGAKILGRYRTVEQIYREYLDFFHSQMAEIEFAAREGEVQPQRTQSTRRK